MLNAITFPIKNCSTQLWRDETEGQKDQETNHSSRSKLIHQLFILFHLFQLIYNRYKIYS